MTIIISCANIFTGHLRNTSERNMPMVKKKRGGVLIETNAVSNKREAKPYNLMVFMSIYVLKYYNKEIIFVLCIYHISPFPKYKQP